jgi:hypothetical protein
LEARVRTYINAAGCAYRAGRFSDAERHVAAGLRLAADGEFASGRYRLRLTSAAVSASRGAWELAIAQLREVVSGPGTPGVMAVLARSLLARLLARRGDAESGRVLEEALRDATDHSYVMGPLAVAQVEVGWLTGTVVPPQGWKAVELADASAHTAMFGELGVYLRRAGRAAAVVPAGVPGPWSPALAGRWREAAAGWEKLGERYEQAVELASADDEAARVAGLAVLDDLRGPRQCSSVPDGPQLSRYAATPLVKIRTRFTAGTGPATVQPHAHSTGLRPATGWPSPADRGARTKATRRSRGAARLRE